MIVRIGLLSAALFCLATPPLSAHHGWGGQQAQESSITGVVTQPVSLAGPHATMKIRVDQQEWDVTLAPSSRTAGAGLRADTLRVGETVTVQGHRSSDPKKFEIKTERVEYNGRTYAVYPNR